MPLSQCYTQINSKMKNIILIYLLSFLLFSCKNDNENVPFDTAENKFEAILTPAQLKNSKIQTGSLEKQSIASVLKVNGKITLAPESIATVSMPLGGYVKAIKVMQGMHVSKGQVLAVVEDAQFVQLQQDYLTTKQLLAFSVKDYNRQKELNTSKAVSDKTYETSQTELAKQRIILKSLEEKLQLIHINPAKLTSENISKAVNIYAPISGLISKVNVNLGKYISATDLLFEILNTQDLFLSLNVFDKDAGNLSIDQKIRAYSNTNDAVYNTSVLYVNKSVNEDNAMEVIAKIKNTTNKLIPGNYMNAEIDITNNSAYTVKNSAIVDFEGKEYLFVKNTNEKFSMTPVVIGTRSKDFSEVKNAKDFVGKEIVINDAYTLLMVLKNEAEE